MGAHRINRIEDAITLESRRQRAAYKRNPSLKNNAGASDSDHAGLPHIAELIADGEITVGMLNPVGYVATDGHNSLAMLKRRPDETLAQLTAQHQTGLRGGSG